MKLIFLSLAYEPASEKIYLKKTKRLLSQTNAWNIELIQGFDRNLTSNEFYVVNCQPFATFPQYKQIIFKETTVPCLRGNNGQTVGFINFPLLKQWIRERRAYKLLVKETNNTTEKTSVLIYSLYLPYLKAAIKAKRKNNKISICLVVTDLPNQYSLYHFHGIKKLVMENLGCQQMRFAKKADKYVLLAKPMSEIINAEKKPELVVEGICTMNKPEISQKIVKKDTITFFYGGGLKEVFGIDNLVRAFMSIKQKNIALNICGIGPSEGFIKECAKTDRRIHFFGFVSQKETLEMERNSDFLVNPRPSKESFVKYSFPSKTMEYLVSGRPLIMFNLPTLPTEYYEYINFFTGDTPEEMARDLAHLLDKDYNSLLIKASKGQEYILNSKNPIVQTRRIIDFLNS